MTVATSPFAGVRRASLRPVWPALVALVVLTAGMVLALGPLTTPAHAVTQPMPPSTDYYQGCGEAAAASGMPTTAGPCRITPKRPYRPTIVLWGDSHALQWVPALQKAAAGRRLNIVGFFMGFCPPFLRTEPARTECSQSNYLALRYVEQLQRDRRPVRVLLGGAWQIYRAMNTGSAFYLYGAPPERYNYPRKLAEIFRTEGPKLFRLLGREGIKTDVIGQAPVVPDPEYLACGGAAASPAAAGPPYFGCPYERSKSLPQEAEIRAWLAAQMAVLPRGRRLVDVADQVCWPMVCPGLRGGFYTFFDVRHVTATRSRLSYRAFLPTVNAVD